MHNRALHNAAFAPEEGGAISNAEMARRIEDEELQRAIHEALGRKNRKRTTRKRTTRKQTNRANNRRN